MLRLGIAALFVGLTAACVVHGHGRHAHVHGPPIAVEVVFHNRAGAQLAALDAGTTLDPVAGSITAEVEDGRELARRFEVWMRLAQSART